ncbi:MAG: hypothetical protein FJ246_01980 [Nitrospira sp.]|nr:hypothetical protein [Nitrospira sp.]
MISAAWERGRSDEQGLLFDYTVKLLLLAGFLELVLYRLVSRLGMHLSKLAQQHEWLRITFKTLSSIGFALLNFVALLLFLALFLVLFNKIRSVGGGRYDRWLVPAVSLLVLVTVAFLLFPPSMIGSVVYNLVFSLVFVILIAEYVGTHPSWPQRGMLACYGLGVTGWLYYQTLSTTYGLLNSAAVPPLVHEVNRAGEALMVLASILVFWAYGSTPLWTKNKLQRRRATIFGIVAGGVFVALLFLDYFLSLYDKALAESIRKAGEGIGWIFQMGMGYTFYLPFAFYMAGLLCWVYTVVKLLTLGRLAGYGLGLMFMAGYALQLSHLSLMVVLGVMLLNLDKRRGAAPAREPAQDGLLSGPPATLVSEQTT